MTLGQPIPGKLDKGHGVIIMVGNSRINVLTEVTFKEFEAHCIFGRT